MQIPNNFKLFSQQWSIRPGTDKELPAELGKCYPDTNEILVSANQTPDSLLHTLAHELLHAIETKMHLEMTERQIDVMALGLMDLFRNNPDMTGIFLPQTISTTEDKEHGQA